MLELRPRRPLVPHTSLKMELFLISGFRGNSLVKGKYKSSRDIQRVGSRPEGEGQRTLKPLGAVGRWGLQFSLYLGKNRMGPVSEMGLRTASAASCRRLPICQTKPTNHW